MRPGSFVINSGVDTAIQSARETTTGSNEGISISAQETISIVSSDDVKTTSGETLTCHAAKNMIVASEGAMVLRCGESEIMLRPNGTISIKGIEINVTGDKICLN